MPKRMFAISLALLLLLGALSGCAKHGETKKIGYITRIDADAMRFDFDEVEWVSWDDAERIEELDLNAEERHMPDGYYIYNPEAVVVTYKINPEAVFEMPESLGEPENDTLSFAEFQKRYHVFKDEMGDNFIELFNIEIENDAVVRIERQYRP